MTRILDDNHSEVKKPMNKNRVSRLAAFVERFQALRDELNRAGIGENDSRYWEFIAQELQTCAKLAKLRAKDLREFLQLRGKLERLTSQINFENSAIVSRYGKF